MLGGLIKAAKNAVDGITEAFALTDPAEMKAVVAACILVAAAEGGVSEAEQAKALEKITGHAALKGFQPMTIKREFDEYVGFVNSDKQLGEDLLYQKVKTLKGKPVEARIRILGVIREVANADGNISKQEQDVIDKIRSVTA